MSLTFQIKPGYLGVCGKCMEREGKHKVYVKFEDNPYGLGGVWVYVCDDCKERMDNGT